MARPSGRRPGDSGTREAIRRAAGRQFAARGYDRTTIRSVAQEADVDPALVRHYYGSKLGLFAQTVDMPVAVQDRLGEVLDGDPDRLGERFARFIVDELENPDGRMRLIGLIRAASSEPAAAEQVREMFRSTHVPTMARAQEDDAAALRAALVSAQVIGVVLARYVVGLEPLASASPDELALALAPALQHLLALDE
jgi:AcrR family transcriptional regulator